MIHNIIATKETLRYLLGPIPLPHVQAWPAGSCEGPTVLADTPLHDAFRPLRQVAPAQATDRVHRDGLTGRRYRRLRMLIRGY
jgi:hypothetical protein